MKLILFISVVLIVVIGVLLIRKYSSVEFVAHAKLLFKAWSVWLGTAGSAISAWVQSFPSAALDAWTSLPPDIKDILPHNYLGFLGAFMVAMAVISQFVRQEKLTEEKQQMDAQP